MKILTGADRVAYEELVGKAALVDYLTLHVKLLEDQAKEFLQRADAERVRADRAVDAQLAVRGFPTVTPRQGMPDIPDVLEEDPEQVAAVEARMAKGDATVFAERF